VINPRSCPERRLKVAIYDTPAVVGQTLSNTIQKAGHTVLFNGPLNEDTACHDADVWVAKWTFLFNRDFLTKYHPRESILTLSVGTDHIDLQAMKDLGLKLDNCPTFSSNSVAEHAMTLALRSLYPACVLPSLLQYPGTVIFAGFSDEFAEAAIAQMLMRARQLDGSIGRAREYEYYRRDTPCYRHDEPWANQELAGSRVLIMGHDRTSFRLANLLHSGFGCELFGFDTSEQLEAYGVKHIGFNELSNVSRAADYVFLCTDSGISCNPPILVDSSILMKSEINLSNSRVAVLGTGRIGSIIARIARRGFDCDVTAFSTTEKRELVAMGVKYASSVTDAIAHANFIFIALPLNEGTRSIIGPEQLSSISSRGGPKVIVNVTRDRIIYSEALYDMLCQGAVFCYATDVLPNDVTLWSHGEPDDITRKFVQHEHVVATPHEGECSRNSLRRLCAEVLDKLGNLEM
jgi:lactate dehydrogenase-like 2-hydroxyacid dehydrogenase